MVYKTKVIEHYDVIYDDIEWTVLYEKDVDSSEIYYTVLDNQGDEVENEDMFNEVIDYFESELGIGEEIDSDTNIEDYWE